MLSWEPSESVAKHRLSDKLKMVHSLSSVLNKHRDFEKHTLQLIITDSKRILKVLILKFEGRRKFLLLVNLSNH